MSRYIHFTDEQREQARRTDLAFFLRNRGEKLKRSGSEYEWKDGSQKVTIRGNVWFHQYEQVGGDAVDFVRRYYNMTYPEAVECLLGESGGSIIINQPVESETKEFELPPKNSSIYRAYAYLNNNRGIHKDVLNEFIRKGMIYESSDYHNAVFVGYDEKGVSRHAHKRGTGSKSTYKGNAVGSMPEYSFHWYGISDKIYVFEAPIDMLSFICMNKEEWHKHSYVAACSVSDKILFHSLREHNGLKKVYLCMDNDQAGEKANNRIGEKLKEQGIDYEILKPIHKDWNEDLFYLWNDTEEKPCQTLQL